MSDSVLVYELEGRVAGITLNRPLSGNALIPEMSHELSDACRRASQDDGVRVVLVSGSGDHFCIGRDGAGPASPMAEFIAAIDKPVIACVHGDALGQGMELALACDIRLGSESARFAMSQLASGFVPGDGGTQRLPRIVGRAKALELLLTGAHVTAREALRIGLVSRLYRDRGELLAEAKALASKMSDMAPYSLRFAKEAINKGMDMTMEQGLRLEADLYFLMHTTRDRVEGVTSFLQKRTPRFEGR